MKRIAFVSTNDTTPWSGSEELWSQTAISMANQGFTVGVNIRGWKQTPINIQKLESLNCRVVRRWYHVHLIFLLIPYYQRITVDRVKVNHESINH